MGSYLTPFSLWAKAWALTDRGRSCCLVSSIELVFPCSSRAEEVFNLGSVLARAGYRGRRLLRSICSLSWSRSFADACWLPWLAWVRDEATAENATAPLLGVAPVKVAVAVEAVGKAVAVEAGSASPVFEIHIGSTTELLSPDFRESEASVRVGLNKPSSPRKNSGFLSRQTHHINRLYAAGDTAATPVSTWMFTCWYWFLVRWGKYTGAILIQHIKGAIKVATHSWHFGIRLFCVSKFNSDYQSNEEIQQIIQVCTIVVRAVNSDNNHRWRSETHKWNYLHTEDTTPK